MEKFAQLIPLNLQEIFIWYFEQKGVDNPERFIKEQEENNILDSNARSFNQDGNSKSKDIIQETLSAETNSQVENQSADENITMRTKQQEQQNQINPNVLVQFISLLMPLLRGKLGKKSTEFGDFIGNIEEQLLSKKEVKKEV